MNNASAVVVLVIIGTFSSVCSAQAQDVRGFVGGGFASDPNSSYPAVAGGVLVDLPTSWVSAGAEGEVFVSWPYFGGRGAAFGQVNLIRRGLWRPFVLGGAGWGVSSGPMIGAGVEARVPGRRLGFRASVEDYLVRIEPFDCAAFGVGASACNGSRGRSSTQHQVGVRLGILF